MAEKLTFSAEKCFLVEKEIYNNPQANTRVLRAVDQSLKRTVIIKEIGFNNYVQKESILNELRNLALLEQYSDYIPYIYNVAVNNKKVLIEMREIKGKSLREYMDEIGKDPKKDQVWYRDQYRIYLQVCKVLADIHRLKGFVHKDIKPENIMINRARQATYIIDFGISGLGAGKGTGTEKYMAPEQRMYSSGFMDQYTDVYAMALVGIELFSGKCPRFGEELLMHPITKEWVKFPEIENIGGKYYPELGKVLKKALSANPEKRYHDARKLYEALKNAGRENGKRK